MTGIESGECMKSSGIGGQAVIEGVMMKNKEQYAVAVRKPDKVIEVKVEKYHGIAEKYSIFKYPILRGVGAFVESMAVGMKTLTYSASFYEEEEEKPSPLEETVGKVFKEKAESVVMGITVAVSILLAVAIFMILPFFIAEYFSKLTDNVTLLALVEGLIRVAIFLLYVVAISQMQDIKRVFMYHGAEHKTINCVENGKELTVENVRTQSRYHKRCGTSFLFIVMFISIFFFMVIRVDNAVLRMLLRILLVPVIAGVSYEFIRLAGRSDNAVVHLLSKPGMWLQSLTTREPENDMIEVAIQSVEAVFDWRAYQKEEKTPREATAKELTAKETAASETAAVQEPEAVIAAEEVKAAAEAVSGTKIRAAKKAENSRTVRETRRERERLLAEEESREGRLKRESGIPIESIVRPDVDDDDDDILKALDKYFDED
ncbi:MAG: DUF1385 domain-containing protein [Acetivibrio ethanolgignens]